jgi:hypothetical protein
LVAALAVWLVLPGATLDPNRVLVFPLQDVGGTGTDVATYIGHVLDGSEPLKWEDVGEPVPRGEQRRRALERRSGYFIDGAIVRQPDSVTVILRLYDVAGDSMLRRAGLSGPAGSSEARLGARVAAALLPALLGAGRSVDIGALGERAPAAIANFLQGERAYRRSRFVEALDHYRAAVAGDSLFAVAAMKGGQAASWLERDTEARDLFTLALARERLLPPRYVWLAQGLLSYQDGEADSAVGRFGHALRLAPEWSEAHMALGEVYYHLIPRVAALDSLAETEFRAALALDSGFSPPLYHLAEIALRQGQPAEARRYADQFWSSRPDSISAPLALTLGCADSPNEYDWTAALARSPDDVLEAARVLAAIPAYSTCGEQAYRAILAEDGAPPARTAAALYGLQSLFTQDGRYREVRELLASPLGARYGGPYLMLVDALAGAPFDRDAQATIEGWGDRYTLLTIRQLWLAALWLARDHQAGPVLAIVRAAESKADSSGARRDRLFADIIAAHARLAAGDTAAAIQRFSALTPEGSRQELAWYPWSSLAYERYTLMRLLAARGDRAGVLQAGAVFDSPQPVAVLLYRRAALGLRIAAAEALNQPGLAGRLRQQGVELDRRRGTEVAMP